MATVSRRTLVAAIAERLEQVTNATGYYGQVGRRLDGTLGDDPAPKSPTDPRVAPYFVLYPGTGTPGPDEALGDCHQDITATVLVTAVAGDVDDLLGLVDRIHNVLHLWAPTVPGVVCGRLKPLPGYEAAQLVDHQVQPPRLFVPLRYQFAATT